MKSFKTHAREIMEAGKSEPNPKAVKKTKRVFTAVALAIFAVGLFGLLLASC